jgi:hypothetical protein
MTKPNRTFKDQKDKKEQAKAERGSKELRRTERGGMRNLLREAREELSEEEAK